MSKLKFVKSAAQLKDFPYDHKPEIAFAGRSNAGKSSLINVLANSKIAKVSGTPGKTRLLNLFDHKDGYRIVDMPGYGYAARSGSEVKSWRQMIESFLVERENLRAILLVMDIRRSWAKDEQMLYEMAMGLGYDFSVALTKADKLSKGRANSAKLKLSQQLSVDSVFPVSCLKKTGLQSIERHLYDQLISASK